MSYDFDYTTDDGIATIRLNRPDVLNALTFDIYGQLRDLMAAVKSDDDVRCVIITGEGKGFCCRWRCPRHYRAALRDGCQRPSRIHPYDR